jgi:hypothetical protein
LSKGGGKNLLSLAQITRPEPNNFYFFGAAFFAADFFAVAAVDNFLLTSVAATAATRPKAGSCLLM